MKQKLPEYVKILLLLLLICSLLNSCGVFYRIGDPEPGNNIYRSVRFETETLEYTWRHNRLPGNGSIVGVRWLERPLISIHYILSMPFCLLFDTIMLPYDIYDATQHPDVFESVLIHDMKTLEKRLKSGKNPNMEPRPPLNRTPLEQAIVTFDLPAVRLLLQYGACPTERTLEMCAILQGDDKKAQLQLLHPEMIIEPEDNLDTYPFEGVSNGQKEVIRTMEKLLQSHLQ